MKKMIVVLFYLSIVLLYPLNGKSQPPAGEGPMGPPPELSSTQETSRETAICQLQTDWLKKKLKLNKSQLTAVENSTARYVNKILVIEKTQTTTSSLVEAKKQAELKRDQEMKTILSEKQYSRYLKIKQILDNSFETKAIPASPGM